MVRSRRGLDYDSLGSSKLVRRTLSAAFLGGSAPVLCLGMLEKAGLIPLPPTLFRGYFLP